MTAHFVDRLSSKGHTLSAPALVTLQMARLCTAIEDALGSISTLGEKQNISMKLLTSPYRLPFGMLKYCFSTYAFLSCQSDSFSLLHSVMTNLTKRLYNNPLYLMTGYNGSWEGIGSITRRLSGLVEGLMVSFMRVSCRN